MIAGYQRIPEHMLTDDTISMQKEIETLILKTVKEHPDTRIDNINIGYYEDDIVNNTFTVRVHLKPKDSI